MRRFCVRSLLLPQCNSDALAEHYLNSKSERDAETTRTWQGSNWYAIYCGALLESDTAKSRAWIECAQRAIQNRLAELTFVPAKSNKEMEALSEAFDHLSLLVEKSRESEPMSWD
jgi:hypothetical protein